MNLKGTKTEANLQAAFAGESQARNKYTYYASQAKKEGYEQISALFTETANNEKEHAKMWFKLLHGGIGKTVDNQKMQLPARTMSGPICMLPLQKRRKRKALITSQNCLRWLPISRKSMKQDIWL